MKYIFYTVGAILIVLYTLFYFGNKQAEEQMIKINATKQIQQQETADKAYKEQLAKQETERKRVASLTPTQLRAEEKAKADAIKKINDDKIEYEIQRRVNAVSLLREWFLDNGADIKVTISGKNKDKLELRYVLFNDVWLHNFKKGSLCKTLGEIGFKSIYFNNGYDYNSGIMWN